MEWGEVEEGRRDQSVNYKEGALKWGGFRLLIKEEFDATNRLEFNCHTILCSPSKSAAFPSVLELSISCHSSYFLSTPFWCGCLSPYRVLLSGAGLGTLRALHSNSVDEALASWRGAGWTEDKGDGSITPSDFPDWISALQTNWGPFGSCCCLLHFSVSASPLLSSSLPSSLPLVACSALIAYKIVFVAAIN